MHGLFKRENAIKIHLHRENIDVVILTETDAPDIRGNFKIQGFETFYPLEMK